MPIAKRSFAAPVTQRLEFLAFNQGVVGSNPTGGTMEKKIPNAMPNELWKRLSPSLTWRGACQWYQSPNRYLNGERPIDVPLEQALEAACALDEGYYV